MMAQVLALGLLHGILSVNTHYFTTSHLPVQDIVGL